MNTKTDPQTEPPLVPDTLTVVMINSTDNYIAIVNEYEWHPYSRRTVQIKLTDEQRRQLAPRDTGMIRGRQTHEEILQAWFEPATEGLSPRP